MEEYIVRLCKVSGLIIGMALLGFVISYIISEIKKINHTDRD